jgi:hypothetical protein
MTFLDQNIMNMVIIYNFYVSDFFKNVLENVSYILSPENMYKFIISKINIS